jgi:hypothetical protein
VLGELGVDGLLGVVLDDSTVLEFSVDVFVLLLLVELDESTVVELSVDVFVLLLLVELTSSVEDETGLLGATVELDVCELG